MLSPLFAGMMLLFTAVARLRRKSPSRGMIAPPLSRIAGRSGMHGSLLLLLLLLLTKVADASSSLLPRPVATMPSPR
jgi:hypothetical protein